MKLYTTRRGTAVRFILHTPHGTDIAGWSATCQMRREEVLRRGVNDVEQAAALAVTSFEGDDARGPGWILTLSSAVSEALEPDVYRLDARIVLSNGDVVICKPWGLELTRYVTEPA